jgi:hypothetical protein
MGGLYGHLSHLHEDPDLTFGEVKLIFQSISKNLIPFTEKVDGQAISVTWKGKTLFARNKGHVQNRAEKALTLNEIIEKFKGRGDLSDAFSLAAEDINRAIELLSEDIKLTVFEKGERFLNLEIIYPASRNVIDYERNLLVPHGVVSYDKNGNAIKEFTHVARLFYHSLSKKDFNTFRFIAPNILRSTQDTPVSSALLSFMDTYALKDSDTIDKYLRSRWSEVVKKIKKSDKLDNTTKNGVINRLAYEDKSLTLGKLKQNSLKDFYEEFVDLEKNQAKKLRKEFTFPLETVFLSYSCDVLNKIEGFIAPISSRDKIKKEVENSLVILSEMENISTHEIKRFYAIGGYDSLHHSEGIVFNYKKKSYKITGSFAVVNQLLGVIKYGRHATENQVS